MPPFSAALALLLLRGALPALVLAAEGPRETALPAAVPREASFEADRKAILSMAGEWRVAYRFEEIFSFKPGYVLRPPYKIAGFEKVVVLEDKGGHISLQHLLVDHKGEVTKHWRQDWDYQRSSFWEFAGRGRWKSLELDPKEVEGSWTETVWNVDDAPRYAGYGRWRHGQGVSEWVSHPLWRPLPRRELTRRSDYELMRSVMHPLVFSGGWILEEENDKVSWGEKGGSVLARELGVITYRRGSGGEWANVGHYLEKTGPFWSLVRSAWDRILERNREVGYKGQRDAKELAESLFAAADRFDPVKESEEQARGEILKLIGEHCLIVPKEERELPGPDAVNPGRAAPTLRSPSPPRPNRAGEGGFSGVPGRSGS